MSIEQYEKVEEYRQLLQDGQSNKVPKKVIELFTDRILVTKEDHPMDLVIEHRFGVVTASTVSGINFVRDWLARMRDFFGGRSRSTENVIEKSTAIAFRELKKAAVMRGANAVIAVDFDYVDKGASMLICVASGTAVLLRTEIE